MFTAYQQFTLNTSPRPAPQSRSQSYYTSSRSASLHPSTARCSSLSSTTKMSSSRSLSSSLPTSMPVRQVSPSSTSTRSSSFVEETLGCESGDQDAPPPYMLLCDGQPKPKYSEREPAQRASQLTASAVGATVTRMDGALCLRCNARKAKAWYLRQKERSNGSIV